MNNQAAAAELRARAAQARRIADQTCSRQAQLELRQMANALEDQADELDSGEASESASN